MRPWENVETFTHVILDTLCSFSYTYFLNFIFCSIVERIFIFLSLYDLINNVIKIIYKRTVQEDFKKKNIKILLMDISVSLKKLKRISLSVTHSNFSFRMQNVFCASMFPHLA